MYVFSVILPFLDLFYSYLCVMFAFIIASKISLMNLVDILYIVYASYTLATTLLRPKLH